MRRFILFISLVCMYSVHTKAQLFIDNATFSIQAGATVTVQGDLTSNVDIQGPGKILLKGSANQNITMNGFAIPNLEMDNTANATLLSNARIGTTMLFTNGKIILGNFNMRLADVATTSGGATGMFFETTGSGQLMKELTADVAAYELPIGAGANYRPAYLTTNGSTYDASAIFGVRVLGTTDPNKPPMIASYLNTNWPVTRSGITGGTVSLSGQYIDPTDISGSEASLIGYYNSGTDWSSVGETHSAASNQVGAPVTAAAGVVSGMNKFLVVGAKAFLQGAYQTPITTLGLMDDDLRVLPFGPASSITNFPQDDPYRQAPYSTTFIHTSNPIVETIPNSGVIGAQVDPANNIVDWIFIELRNLNASPGNLVLQSRSALIQRDGDIVDVDGVSPVTFNGLLDGNYIISVRHRNHLGLSLDQSAPKYFTETKSLAYSAPKIADLMNASDANLFGTSSAFTSISLPGPVIVKALWAGNSNIGTPTAAGGIKYVTPNSDNGTILGQVLAFPGNVSGLFNYSSAIGYYSGDNNMNRTVKYTTPNADGAIILSNILSLSTLFNYSGLLQQIPN